MIQIDSRICLEPAQELGIFDGHELTLVPKLSKGTVGTSKGPGRGMAAMLSSWQELRLNLWFMVNMISPFNNIFICRIL